MKFLSKIERKLGKYAIPNLSLVMILCFTLGYILQIVWPNVYVKLIFIPYNVVLGHEYWRLFTWIVTTPSSFSIFTLVMLFFYYRVGRELEYTWGKFMYNLYIFSGLLLETLGLLLVSLYYYKWSADAASHMFDYNGYISSTIAGVYVTYYMVMSMYLAFAAIYPDTIVMFCFVIPMKMKWLAYIDLIYLAYSFITGDIFIRAVILTSVLNFFIYYFVNRSRNGRSLKDIRRQQEFRRKVNSTPMGRRTTEGSGTGKVIPFKNGNPEGITIHKCAICGRTEKDGDDLEFRFCSKCNGNYEYCSEHLFTHEHVR
jgi:hypothetical protein